MRLIFASGLQAGFVLPFRWIPSELICSDKGSRFFDRDYDPSKSLLHVLALHLTRPSPARTIDLDCSSLPLMHLDLGHTSSARRWYGRVVQIFLCPESSVLSRVHCFLLQRWIIEPLWLARKLWRFHRCKKRWRQLTLARTRGTMPAPVWESTAAQLTHPSQCLHIAAIILILLVTYMRPSGLLSLSKKDIVTPLVPLLPCWSVVIAASKPGASTKTRVRDGSVLIYQPMLQWVNKLLWLQAVNREERGWNFDYRAAAKMLKTASDSLELSGMTMYETLHSGASVGRVRSVHHFALHDPELVIAPLLSKSIQRMVQCTALLFVIK